MTFTMTCVRGGKKTRTRARTSPATPTRSSDVTSLPSFPLPTFVQASYAISCIYGAPCIYVFVYKRRPINSTTSNNDDDDFTLSIFTQTGTTCVTLKGALITCGQPLHFLSVSPLFFFTFLPL